jgi:hypothetical protein
MSDSHYIGTLALVDVGVTIYSRTRRHARDDRPVGGVVIDTTGRPVIEDGEPTGEVARTYEVLDVYEPVLEKAFDFIDEADVDHENMEPVYDATLRKLVCRLDEAVAKQKGKAFDHRHHRYQVVAGRLMAVVFGGQP